jgi:hypothetical protein
MPVAIKYCTKQLHDLWDGGASYAEIAAVLGCSHSYVHDLKVRHKLPNRQRPTREIFENDPTPDQIRERAAEIRERHMAEMRAMR